jgi:hypothetical protein
MVETGGCERQQETVEVVINEQMVTTLEVVIGGQVTTTVGE